MVPITDISQLDFNKKYSYADYLSWQFTERVELIKGWLFKMSPAPKVVHQVISGNLYFELKKFFSNTKCAIFAAPFDVRLVKNKGQQNKEIDTVVQPDICVICDSTKLDEAGCIGAPDLIVEITSISTAKRDYNEKFNLYEANGVKEYWIVNPEGKTCEVYFRTKNEKFEISGSYDKTSDLIESRLFPGIKIKFLDVFG